MATSIRQFRESHREGRGNLDPLQIIEGFLDEDLPAASNVLTGATITRGTLIEWSQDKPPTGQDKGDWDALANSPTLASSTGTSGDYYRVSVDGTTALDGITTWVVDQYLQFNGTHWVRRAPVFYETETTVWLVNRDKTLTASADYYFTAAFINGEWRVLWVSCEVAR